MGLHNEHVAAAHALGKTWADLAVGELDNIGVAQGDTEVSGHFLSERWVRAPGVERQTLGGHLLHVLG